MSETNQESFNVSKGIIIILCSAVTVLQILCYVYHDRIKLLSDQQSVLRDNLVAVSDELHTVKSKYEKLGILKQQIVGERVNEWAVNSAKSIIPYKNIEEIVRIAGKYRNWKLILATISVESNFDQYAKSDKGAGGLMQVMHSVWKDELNIKNIRDIYDVEMNIQYGNAILERYIEQCDGDIKKALFKYVGGDNAYHKKVLAQYAELDFYINNIDDDVANRFAQLNNISREDQLLDIVVQTVTEVSGTEPIVKSGKWKRN